MTALRELRARPRLVDAVLAVLVAAYQLAGATELGDPFGAHARPLGLVLAAVSALPLALRRRFPIPALAACVVLMGVFYALGFRSQLGQLSVVIAAYTVWAHCRFRDALAVTVLGLIAYETSMLFGSPVSPVGDTLISLLLAVGVAAIGRTAHVRSHRIRRAEHDTELAVAEERVRIAHELHDVVSHHLSVIAVQANLARYVFESAPDTARTALDTITGTTTEALDELRRLLSVLRPPQHPLEGYRPQPGLGDLGILAARVREAGVAVDLRVTGEARTLPPGQQLCAFRVAQEALTNVLKHGGPTAELTLDYGTEHLVLGVTDPGGGSSEPPNPGGHGLIGMRERARMYGGVIEIGPRDPAGFAVVLTLPYPRPVPQPQEPE
ncbi:sensor histidine kinase [Amycolatopsis sp., V23-08]|uniref:histidine kinase n=1 Tax=Amycolatopsis heterodermiae TaxID=3110235 RepID=A0ABU5QZ05_9PSEU|nr:sensor histidine kinase [Amycolatopsis sp., V23-08]MEA5358719.1 sensor histidine kinase [Amycolatopsis sp., V23-08]